VKTTIESLERDTMGDSWRIALEKEFMKPYFHKVCSNYLALHFFL